MKISTFSSFKKKKFPRKLFEVILYASIVLMKNMIFNFLVGLVGKIEGELKKSAQTSGGNILGQSALKHQNKLLTIKFPLK